MPDYSRYPRKTVGHILACLLEWGIPLNTVETLSVRGEENSCVVITSQREVFARFKYFDELKQPLFQFREDSYNQQHYVLSGDGKLKPRFRLQLSPHDTPGLVFSGNIATPHLHCFIQRTLTQYTTDPWYDVHKAAAAFFQGGSHDQNGNYIYIEFWSPGGAQAYVDKLNAEYDPADPVTQEIVDYNNELNSLAKQRRN
jgi:hypothetical protein